MRADELLMRFLTPAQQQEWRTWFEVTVEGRRHNFRIEATNPHYIRVYAKTGRPLGSAGYYPDNLADLPIADRVLAQVMAVRHNLADIERKACGVDGIRQL